jgi:hypothetical protein
MTIQTETTAAGRSTSQYHQFMPAQDTRHRRGTQRHRTREQGSSSLNLPCATFRVQNAF